MSERSDVPTKMTHRFVLISLFFILNCSVCLKNDKKENSTFTPTREWQKIKEGQSIPPGLQIRVNLQTGEKEAKLPDEGNSKKSLIAVGEKETQEKTTTDEVQKGNPDEVKKSKSDGRKRSKVDERKKRFKPDELKKKIRADDLKKILEKVKSDDVSSDKGPSKKLRSYNEIKEDFSNLQIQIKTDLEILTGLIQSFRKFHTMKVKKVNTKNPDGTDDEVILTALVDLEYLVHQYDNAQEFVKLNGFSDVIYKSLNSSNSEIRSEALRLLGSATQSNPKVQAAAVDSGSIHLLLKILAFDEDMDVRTRSLYALSCLLRRFPAAQAKFIADGGLTAFAKVFEERKQYSIKLHIKILTLIHDLLYERRDVKLDILEEENKSQSFKMEALKEKLTQYEKMDLEKKLVEQDWCTRIADWFTNQNYNRELSRSSEPGITLDDVNLETHGVIESVVNTLYIFFDLCKTHFESDTDLVNLLFELRDLYNSLSVAESNKEDDDSDLFYTGLSNILKALTDKLKRTPDKDEL